MSVMEDQVPLREGRGVERRRWLRDRLSQSLQSGKAFLLRKKPSGRSMDQVQVDEDGSRDQEPHTNNTVDNRDEEHHFRSLDEEYHRGGSNEMTMLEDGVQQSRSTIRNRENRELEWKRHQMDEKRRKEETVLENMVKDGESFVREVHQGRVLFYGTKLPELDPLKREIENTRAEAEILVKAHSEWENSKELKAYLASGLSDREKEERRVAFERDVALFQNQVKENDKKDDFLKRVREASSEAKKAKDIAEEAAAEAFAIFEKLRKQHNMLTFEARAMLRRKMVAKQSEAKELAKLSDLAQHDVQLLKRHLVERGLEPDTFVSAKETFQETSDEIGKGGNNGNGDANNVEETNKDHDIETEIDYNSWDQVLREGYKLGHLELMDRSQRRINQMAAATAAKAKSEQKEYERILKRISEERKTAINGKQGENSGQQQQEETDPEALDHVTAAMSTMNVTIQQKSQLIGSDQHQYVVRGMTRETAPPICEDWGLLKCPLKPAECRKRHFYVSKEEQSEWVEKRSEVDSRHELAILEAISERETIIDCLKREIIKSQNRFDSHLSGFVQLEDIAPLLHLMNKLRIASVKVVEGIIQWRRLKRVRLNMYEGSQQVLGDQDHLKRGHWIVKLGYLGEVLYPPSKAFKSKAKRFNRDADRHPKRAVHFKMLGIFETRLEAMRAYETEIKKLAVEKMASLDAFPKPKVIIRTCGKHFAVESDMGVENTRCEICFADSMNKLGSYNPPYFWNGQNYLLKMLHDSDFLDQVTLLKMFLQDALDQNLISLRRNPLLLATDIANGSKRMIKVKNGDPYNGKTNYQRIVQSFGVPTNAILLQNKGKWVEWFGHLSSTGKIKIGENLAYISQFVTNHSLVRDFVRNHNNVSIEILDMKRIRTVQRVLNSEAALARYMTESKFEAKKEAIKMELEAEKLARKEDRRQRRALGEEVQTSDEEDEYDDEDELDDDDMLLNTTGDVLTEEERLDLRGIKLISADNNRNKTQAELIPEKDVLHTAYFWDKGEYVAIEQKRHELVGKKDKIWCAGSMFDGIPIRGRHSKEFHFKKKLEEKGKALIQRRQRIQNRLQRSLRRKEKCNPDTIQELIEIGREAGGSLLLLDCDNAEKFLKEWRLKRNAAITLQRNFRGAIDRTKCRSLRQLIAKQAAWELDRDRKCAKVAKKFMGGILRNAKKGAHKRIKVPLTTFAANHDGEPLLISAYEHPQTTRNEVQPLIEPCFACLGLSRFEINHRRLGWLTVRGKACIPNDLGAAEKGIVRLNRVKETKEGGGPCYCRRKEPSRDKIVLTAYNPQTSISYVTTLPLTTFLSFVNLNPQSFVQSRSVVDRLRANPESRFDLTTFQYQGHHVVEPKQQLNEDQWKAWAVNENQQMPLENVLHYWCRLGLEVQRLAKHRVAVKRIMETWKTRYLNAVETLEWNSNALASAKKEIKTSHALKLAAQIHQHAMISAADKAMSFSKNQLELYENLNLSTNQQSWDPIENANDAIYIQRKWQARKAVLLAAQRKVDARKRLFNALLIHAEQAIVTERMGKKLAALKLSMKNLDHQYRTLRKLCDFNWNMLHRGLQVTIKQFLTLRMGNQSRAGRMSRSLLITNQAANLNLLFRKGKSLFTPRFLDYPLRSRMGILSVYEDSSHASSTVAVPPNPPDWFRSQFTYVDGARNLQQSYPNAHDPICTLNGHRFANHDEILTLKETLRMLVRNPTATWDLSLKAKWSMGFDIDDAIRQPPYVGMLSIQFFVQDCCDVVEFVVNPIELRELLFDRHAHLPGRAIPEVFSHRYVERRLSGCRTYDERRVVIRNLRMKVISRLVELVHIGTFDQEIRLGKLNFFRRRRALFQRLFETQWWKDFCRGRSSLQGHKIYQGVHRIADATAAVSVYENCGDLTIHVSWTNKRLRRHRRGKKYPREMRVVVSDDAVRESFLRSEELDLLSLWKQSVACCRYPVIVIQAVLKRLTLLEHTKMRHGLCLNGPYHNTPYTGLRTRARLLAGSQPKVPKPAFTNKVYTDTDMRMLVAVEDMYSLVHREVTFVSGMTLLVSVKISSNGDVFIVALDEKQAKLSLLVPKPRIRSLLYDMGKMELMSKPKSLGTFLVTLLAVRHAPKPPETIREHPLFARFAKMMQVGVPREGIVQAILLDKEKILTGQNPREIIHVVLEMNHGQSPPEKFRLPSPKERLLVLSQVAPEEHFRLIHRGPGVTKDQVPFQMEIMERNRNIWVRVRRETALEQSNRVISREIQQMELEDSLAREVAEFTKRFRDQKSSHLRQNRLDNALIVQDTQRSYKERIRRKNMLKKRVEKLEDALEHVLLSLELDRKARIGFKDPSLQPTLKKLVEGNPVPNMLHLRKRIVKRLNQHPIVISIFTRTGRKEESRCEIHVYLSSHVKTIVLEFDLDDLTGALASKARAMFKKFVGDGLGVFVPVPSLMKAKAKTILRYAVVSQTQEKHFVRVVLVEDGSDELLLETFHPKTQQKFLYKEGSSTDLTPPAHGERSVVNEAEFLPTETRAMGGYIQSDAPDNIDEVSLTQETESKPPHISAHEITLKEVPRPAYPWKEDYQLLERFLEACFEADPRMDRVFAEIYSRQALVGDGPVTGGSMKEVEEVETSLLTKHSITFDSRFLDIVSCSGLYGFHNEALLGRVPHSAEGEKLAQWIANRLVILHAKDRNGKDDYVSFDRNLLCQGFAVPIAGGKENDMEYLIGQARVSSDNASIIIDAYNPIQCAPIVSRKFNLFHDRTMDRRQLDVLAWQEPALWNVTSDLLEPRNMHLLCKEMFRRSYFTRNQMSLADKDSKELTVQNALSEDYDRFKEAARSYKRNVKEVVETSINDGFKHCLILELEYQARVLELQNLVLEQSAFLRSALEWNHMLMEDSHANYMRPFLAASSSELEFVRKAFSLFDKDGNGVLTKREFQQIIYELGQVLTDEEVDQAIKEIDKDENGMLDFMEFAMWWFINGKPRYRNKYYTNIVSNATEQMQQLKSQMTRRFTRTKTALLKRQSTLNLNPKERIHAAIARMSTASVLKNPKLENDPQSEN